MRLLFWLSPLLPRAIFDVDTAKVWFCPSRTCPLDSDGFRTDMLWLAANAARVVTQPDERCNAGLSSVEYPPLWQPGSWRNNPVLSSHSNGATGDGVEYGEGAPEPLSKNHGKTTIFLHQHICVKVRFMVSKILFCKLAFWPFQLLLNYN